MPKKRGSRAAPPMTAEEELLLLQSRALAEEEAAKKKRELLNRFLKDKLAKEKRNSALNLLKVDTRWRSVLREAKDKLLRQDVEILSQTFARVMDCKDSVIESLIRDLEEAEEQHARALRSHLHNIDRLLELQRRRLRCLQEGYDAQLEALKTEFEEERRLILEQHERESCCLQDIMLATEQNYAKTEEEITMNFQSAQADMKNKSLWDTEYSRLQLSGKVEGLWEQLQRAVQSYTEATEHQKITFEVLKQKDKKSSREIKMQMKKLQKLQDLVTATKGQLVAHRRENEERNRQAREEKEKLMRQLQELESRMSQARTKARGDLARLTVQSNAALKALVKVVEKAQRVLRLAEMCRRLEMEEEKVLPFYSSSLGDEEQRDAQRALEEMPTEPLARAMQDYVGLERFWQRFNKVKLEEQALERAREVLRERNRRLRGALRRCLAGFSVHQEVLGEPDLVLAIECKSHGPRELPYPAQGPQGDVHPDDLLGGDKSLDAIHSSGGTS